MLSGKTASTVRFNVVAYVAPSGIGTLISARDLTAKDCLMDPLETTLVSNPPSAAAPPSSGRHRSPLREVIDSLHGLSLAELADVFRYVQRVRASRGDRPSPEFVSRLVAVIGRLYSTYPDRVPISLVRAHFATVPRGLVEQALSEAEKRHLLRLEPVDLPAPFVEVSAGIQDARGLLYWIVPTNS